MTDQEFQERIDRLKRFGWLALFGGGLAAMASNVGDLNNPVIPILVFIAFLCVTPAMFYLVALTIWHWKGRYKGGKSDLWGVLLIVEVSGWFKLIYLFRHIIPDAQQRGRYASVPEVDGA